MNVDDENIINLSTISSLITFEMLSVKLYVRIMVESLNRNPFRTEFVRMINLSNR